MSTAGGAERASTLGDPAFFAGDPDTELADQRRECPVRWHDDGEFWAVCRYRDIQTVGKDPGTFCSGLGVLMADRRREIAAQDAILYLDPPRHGSYRKLVSRAFTPRRVADLEPRIRQLTMALLDAIDPGRPVDLVDALTAPLPLLVIAELLGLPAEDREDFRRWSDALLTPTSPSGSGSTSASGPASLASKPGCCSTSFCGDGPTTGPSGQWCGCRRRCLGRSRACRCCPPGSARRARCQHRCPG